MQAIASLGILRSILNSFILGMFLAGWARPTLPPDISKPDIPTTSAVVIKSLFTVSSSFLNYRRPMAAAINFGIGFLSKCGLVSSCFIVLSRDRFLYTACNRKWPWDCEPGFYDNPHTSSHTRAGHKLPNGAPAWLPACQE